MKEVERYINTNTSVRFRKRKSTEEKTKKTAKLIKIQIICLLKKNPKFSRGVKLFIVTSPAIIMGSIKKTKSQSILLEILFTVSILRVFSVMFYSNCAEKMLYIGIISFTIIGVTKGSGHVKLITLVSSGFNTSK